MTECRGTPSLLAVDPLCDSFLDRAGRLLLPLEEKVECPLRASTGRDEGVEQVLRVEQLARADNLGSEVLDQRLAVRGEGNVCRARLRASEEW